MTSLLFLLLWSVHYDVYHMSTQHKAYNYFWEQVQGEEYDAPHRGR